MTTTMPKIAADPTTASWYLDAGVRCDYGSCHEHAKALSVLVIDAWVEVRPMCHEHAEMHRRVYNGVYTCFTITPSNA